MEFDSIDSFRKQPKQKKNNQTKENEKFNRKKLSKLQNKTKKKRATNASIDNEQTHAHTFIQNLFIYLYSFLIFLFVHIKRVFSVCTAIFCVLFISPLCVQSDY